MDVAPRCRVAYKHLMDGMGAKFATALIPEGRYTTIANYGIYVSNLVGGELRGIIIVETNDPLADEIEMDASHGELNFTNLQLTLVLHDVKVFALKGRELQVARVNSGRSRSTQNPRRAPIRRRT